MSQMNAQQQAVTHKDDEGKGILITGLAMDQLARLCTQQGQDQVLRVGVRSGGCSGMSYTMDFVPTKEINDDDEVYMKMMMLKIFTIPKLNNIWFN